LCTASISAYGGLLGTDGAAYRRRSRIEDARKKIAGLGILANNNNKMHVALRPCEQQFISVLLAAAASASADGPGNFKL
jgi:hypothetical protein